MFEIFKTHFDFRVIELEEVLDHQKKSIQFASGGRTSTTHQLALAT